MGHGSYEAGNSEEGIFAGGASIAPRAMYAIRETRKLHRFALPSLGDSVEKIVRTFPLQSGILNPLPGSTTRPREMRRRSAISDLRFHIAFGR